jgi:DNA-binding XRE family transcriptional regulator
MSFRPSIQTAKRSSYSQEKLAEIVGVNLRTIQRIEKSGLASLQTRSALAKAFGVKPEDPAKVLQQRTSRRKSAGPTQLA